MSFLRSSVEVETEVWRSYDSGSVTMATRASYSEENNLKWKSQILNQPSFLQDGCQRSPRRAFGPRLLFCSRWGVLMCAAPSCDLVSGATVIGLGKAASASQGCPTLSVSVWVTRCSAPASHLPVWDATVLKWGLAWNFARSVCHRKNAFIWSFTVDKPQHASDNRTRRPALYKLQLHFNLIWLNLCASGQMESG